MLTSNAEGENVCNLHTAATGLKDRHGYMRVEYTGINNKNATRYRWPNFSNSAMTQSVTHGMPRKKTQVLSSI